MPWRDAQFWVVTAAAVGVAVEGLRWMSRALVPTRKTTKRAGLTISAPRRDSPGR